MDGISISRLREMCDKHQDGRGRPCPAWVTQLNVDHLKQIRDAANIALNIHNQNGQNNFILETVHKLNFVCEYLCMTFSAKNAETNESCLFRGVVHATADTVLLCEIKEPRHIGIPSDRVENYVEALFESKACAPLCSPYKRNRARFEEHIGDDFADGFVDVTCGTSYVSIRPND